jgi:hypothetical protein
VAQRRRGRHSVERQMESKQGACKCRICSAGSRQRRPFTVVPAGLAGAAATHTILCTSLENTAARPVQLGLVHAKPLQPLTACGVRVAHRTCLQCVAGTWTRLRSPPPLHMHVAAPWERTCGARQVHHSSCYVLSSYGCSGCRVDSECGLVSRRQPVGPCSKSKSTRLRRART